MILVWGTGADTNDYNKVFSLIDASDYSAQCLTEGNCTISKYYALNLITGVEATDSAPQYIFPGSFINPISDNFNIIYEKAELTVNKQELTGETSSLTLPYGDDLSTVIATEFDFAYDDTTETVFPDGIPYYFENIDASDTKEYMLGDKMNVGTYTINIRDIADNYTLDHGTSQITITKATLTVDVTEAENIKYGEVPSISAEFSGFAYSDDADTSNDEDASTLFPEDEGGIPYFFMKQGETPDNCVDCTKYTIGGTAKMNVGVYDIFISDEVLVNYKLEFAAERGTLTVEPALLTFDPSALIVAYGETPEIEPNFGDFAYGEGVSNLNNATYYFKKDGDPTEYTIGGPDIMNVGVYEIFINDDVTDNYSILRVGSGILTIEKATLSVEISPNELIVNQGDMPVLYTRFVSGSVYGEELGDVFGSVVPYKFEDEYGDTFYDTSVPGVFKVRISDPANYVIAYVHEATLLVNPDNDSMKKIRVYADCVKYNNESDDYTVTYRYENDNDDIVFVAAGPDNKLKGNVLAGELPTSFIPGSGTFEIRFDGKRLTWSLTTYGSTNKSSVSSLNQSGTGECDAKNDGTYTLFPNPVTAGNNLTITQNFTEVSTVYILDLYGRILYTDDGFDGNNDTVLIDMSDAYAYPSGMYIIRIISAAQVRTYNIIKE